MHNGFEIAGQSIQGKRPQNQDAILFQYLGEHPSRWIIAVADGMGGAAGGEIASGLAIEVLKNKLDEELDQLLTRPETMKAFLARCVEAMQMEIRNRTERDPAYNGMGTTFSALLCLDDRYVWCNIGDSRIYQFFADGSFSQVSRDHSYVQDLLDQGIAVNAEQLRRFGHVITRVVDGSTHQPDLFPQEMEYARIEENTTGFLVCSDGLLLESSDNQAFFSHFYQAKPLKKIGQDLSNYALAEGSNDNISVVLARSRDYKDGEVEAAPTTARQHTESPTLRIIKQGPVRRRKRPVAKGLIWGLVIGLGLAAAWYFLYRQDYQWRKILDAVFNLFR